MKVEREIKPVRGLGVAVGCDYSLSPPPFLKTHSEIK